MKASVELCINKLSGAAAKSDLKAKCKKFGSELGDLRMSDDLADSCVSSVMAFCKGTEWLAIWLSPYTKWEAGVNEPTTAASLCFASQEECTVCKDAARIIKPKLDDIQCGFRRGRSVTEQIATLQRIFQEILVRMSKTSTHVLSTRENIWPGSSWKAWSVAGVWYWLMPLAGRQLTVLLLRRLCSCRRS